MKLPNLFIILASALTVICYLYFKNYENNTLNADNPARTGTALQSVAKNKEFHIQSNDEKKIHSKQCESEMKDLIIKLGDDIKINNKEIYHLIEHANASQVEKENYLESLGVGLSAKEFRKNLPQLSAVNVESAGKIMEAVDIIKLTRMLSNNSITELSRFLASNPSLMEKKINNSSIFSFALANVKKDSISLAVLNILIEQGFRPTVLDLTTAIDANKSSEFIDSIISKMNTDLNESFNIGNVQYNLVTYSISREQYDQALHFYRVHGVELNVINSYNALDFINYTDTHAFESAKELIYSAVQLEIIPAKISQVPAYLKYINNNFQSHTIEKLASQSQIIKEKIMKQEALEPERYAKLQKYIEKGNSLSQQLKMLNAESGRCINTKSLTAAENKQKSITTDSTKSENESNILFLDGSLSQAKMLFKAALSVTDDEIADSVVIDKSFNLIHQGELDEGLSSLDGYLETRSKEEKSKVYSVLLARCVREMKSAGVIQQLMNRGAQMNERAIFMFIINNNIQAVDVYKKYHDISIARSVNGLTPMEYAVKMKADADLISRLQ